MITSVTTCIHLDLPVSLAFKNSLQRSFYRRSSGEHTSYCVTEKINLGDEPKKACLLKLHGAIYILCHTTFGLFRHPLHPLPHFVTNSKLPTYPLMCAITLTISIGYFSAFTVMCLLRPFGIKMASK